MPSRFLEVCVTRCRRSFHQIHLFEDGLDARVRTEIFPDRIVVNPFQTERTFREGHVQRIQRPPVISQPMLNQGDANTAVASLTLEFQ